jgi:thiamine biosynthesis protein ThiS
MKIIVNGEASEVPDALTVRALVEQLGLTTGLVAVEVNKAIVVRANHLSHVLSDGDVVELVQLVGGG